MTTRAAQHAQNTLLQGLIAAFLMGASTGILDWLRSGSFDWHILLVSGVTTALTSAVAYVQHAYLAPYLSIRRGIGGK